MTFRSVLARLSLLVVALAAAAVPAHAQVFAQPYARGFTQPIAFVQDPSDPTVQFVAEQTGGVRIIKNGIVQPAPYVTVPVLAAGECGLLGLAIPPNYAASGYIFVYSCADGGINTVVSRYTRSIADPLRADPASRFDLKWPDGNRFLSQPFGNHKGGNMAFGPDGFLYIGTGDGGSGNDPGHLAQHPLSLLGKMLRIDTDVDASDPADERDRGYRVPATNPYFNRTGILKEIWAFGLRNPWRWSFDNPQFGGTGAMLIGDVGQGRWEEVDYQPPGVGGRNYGWRNREGAHVNVDVPASPGPFLDPAQAVIDPIHEYPSTTGHAVTGGIVYRGNALDSSFRGRYFFGDFVNGRIWSLGLDQSTPEATPGTLIEHTAALGLGAQAPASFGTDAAGEIYICSWVSGRIYKLVPAITSDLRGTIEQPGNGANQLPFTVSGFALDYAAQSGSGVNNVHVWAVPTNGAPAIFLGQSYGVARPDIAAALGSEYANSGFSVPVSSIPNGRYQIIAYARSTITGAYQGLSVRIVDILREAVVQIRVPGNPQNVPGRAELNGFAIDLSATSGIGVDTVHVWAMPPGGGAMFVGAVVPSSARDDVATTYGAQFRNSGWQLTAPNLAPGPWTFLAYLHSSVTNEFRAVGVLNITVTSGLRMFIDAPAQNQVLTAGQSATLVGWALDYGSINGSGINGIHIWAVNEATGAATFIGAPTLGTIQRPDVRNAFGGSSQFLNVGFAHTFTPPPVGTYQFIVYARSVRTGSFDIAFPVRVIVR